MAAMMSISRRAGGELKFRIFIVDIAVPRDVEPEISELHDVFLYTIDDLTDIIEENVRQRHSAAQEAEQVVEDGAAHYVRERRAHHGQGLLRNFRTHAESIQQAELDKALRELHAGADPEKVISGLARALTNKLIHPPTVAIRDASADGRNDLLDYLKTLYRLD